MNSTKKAARLPGLPYLGNGVTLGFLSIIYPRTYTIFGRAFGPIVPDRFCEDERARLSRVLRCSYAKKG